MIREKTLGDQIFDKHEFTMLAASRYIKIKKLVIIFTIRDCYLWVPILNRQVSICSHRYTKFFAWKLRIRYFHCIKEHHSFNWYIYSLYMIPHT